MGFYPLNISSFIFDKNILFINEEVKNMISTFSWILIIFLLIIIDGFLKSYNDYKKYKKKNYFKEKNQDILNKKK